MFRILSTLSLLALLSCQNENGSQPNTTADTTHAVAPNSDSKALEISGCYLRSLNRDTLVASLQQDGDRITGKLSYDNFEKDGSSGSVHGYIKGNVIRLLYAFRSEGMNSVMEVYFRSQGDSLLQGVGERTNRGDTVFFANPSAVTFEESNPLKKTECAALDEKYR